MAGFRFCAPLSGGGGMEGNIKMKTHAVGSQGLTTSVEGLGTMGMTAMYGARDDAESVMTLNRGSARTISTCTTSTASTRTSR
jgi:hypothetical protein